MIGKRSQPEELGDVHQKSSPRASIKLVQKHADNSKFDDNVESLTSVKILYKLDKPDLGN